MLHVVNDASHMLMMEQPDHVNQVLQTFINAGSERDQTCPSPTAAAARNSPRDQRKENDTVNESCQKAAFIGNDEAPMKQRSLTPRQVLKNRTTSAKSRTAPKSAKSIPRGLVSANFTHKDS